MSKQAPIWDSVLTPREIEECNVEKMATVGIDLGTSNSCIAVVKNGKVEVIANDFGERTTPSVIAFDGDSMSIGKIAKWKVSKCPETVFNGLKYLIGRKYNDSQLEEFRSKANFHMIEIDHKIQLSAKTSSATEFYLPEELSALLLKELKTCAEKYLGDQKIDSAVITVPTYFDNCSRQATIDAGKLAGFKTVHLLNEPTAAALAYKIENSIEKKCVLVFDFGGGTLDIAILIINKDECNILAIDGDIYLGGENIDYNVTNYLAQELLSKYGKDITTDKRKMARLKVLAENAKIRLSFENEVDIEIPELFRDIFDVEIKLTRDKFNEINDVLFTKCMDTMKRCIERANMRKEDIDVALLIGGSTRVWSIRDQIQNYIGKIMYDINPDEAVAIGAAIMASKISGSEFKETKVSQLCAHSLGKIDYRGESKVFIPKFSKIPIKKTDRWYIIDNEYPDFVTDVTMGESTIAKENKQIGHFVIKNISKAANGRREANVTFEIDNNGILKVTADDMQGKSDSLVINLDKGNLTIGEINQLIKKIEKKYIAYKHQKK